MWGATLLNAIIIFHKFTFQSTLPVWGATQTKANKTYEKRISIHAPRVGSDFVPNRLTWQHWKISIHAPRVGSDDPFNDLWLGTFISIHAPRVGSDWSLV